MILLFSFICFFIGLYYWSTNIQHLKAFVKYLLHFQVFKRLFHDSRFNDLSANRNHSLIWDSEILEIGSTRMYFLFAPVGMENVFPAAIFALKRRAMPRTDQSHALNSLQKRILAILNPWSHWWLGSGIAHSIALILIMVGRIDQIICSILLEDWRSFCYFSLQKFPRCFRFHTLR